jgi:hypothetical protein
VKGLYTVPTGSGAQFTNGCDEVWDLGLRTLKIYLTKDYLTDYPLQSSWSSTPTTLTGLAQTTQVADQLARAWDTVMITAFTFANGTTNWWRVEPTNARLAAEYTEIYNLARHLLTTYSTSGRTFILQNWEGDWAFGDQFVEDTNIDRRFVDFYAAFLAVRQKAVSDARAAGGFSNVRVMNAVEVNRVTDAFNRPHRRRIITDIAARLQPDIVSYSAYDSTIADLGYGANFAAWQAACERDFGLALKQIKRAFPKSLVQIGEVGFPENEMLSGNGGVGYSPGDMLEVVRDVAEAHGVTWFVFWQVFDNETSALPEMVRGYWMVKPDGSTAPSGTKMAAFASGS